MTTTALVTGAGGPAGISVIRSLLARGDRVIAADADRLASGLYLVPAQHRVLVPPGLSAEFAPAVLRWCRLLGVDVLFPTVDVELPVLAARQARTRRTIRVAPAHGAARARGTDHWPKRSTSAAMTLSALVRRRSAPDRPLGRRTRPAGRRHRRPGRRHRPPRSRWPSGSAPDMGDTGGTEGVFAYGCVCPPFLALAKQVPAGLFGCGAPGRSS